MYSSIAGRIAKAIRDGTNPLGALLPGERDLTVKFDVSRVRIRKAEVALEA